MPLPRFISSGLIALCALLAATIAPASAGASAGVDLRVATLSGTLADQRQFTDTTSVPTSPAAKCFFGGKGGTGKPFATAGPNALGAAVEAAQSDPTLNPIAVTDEFSFGLGVCGFGGINSGATEFWQVRVNHIALQVAGNLAILGSGDEVLWVLAPNPVCEPNPPFTCQPTAPELKLEAPAKATPGSSVPVQVTEYNDAGVPKPAVGAAVTGAGQPTDASGATSVVVSSTTSLTATRAGAIPSQTLEVCANAKPKRCAASRGRAIFGSESEDAIGGTAGHDRIKARGDDDTIRVRGGNKDQVDCGAGSDLVQADRKDKVDKRSCEEILRPKGKKKKKGGKKKGGASK